MTPEMIEIAISTFVTLFVVIDPIGIAPMVGALTGGAPLPYQRRMAIKGTMVGGAVLFLFALLGDGLMKALGIGMPAFKTAGGILLFMIALEMISEKRTKRREKRTDAVEAEMDLTPEDDDISVFPIGVPFIAGPGSIATVMLMMSANQGHELAQGVILATLGGTLVVSLLIIMAGTWVLAKMGNTITMVITRVMGIILAALAAQFVFDGVKGAFGI